MEIIKHGNLNPIRFRCQRCGCEFAANMTEYQEAWSNKKKYFIVNCPDCNDVIYELEQEARVYHGGVNG